ncbi:hypothetical protein N9X12_09060, partial [Alphaproteobacteria bacterium]|nr:hypothetical protein [Alphaproteobacteria bacterium]
KTIQQIITQTIQNAVSDNNEFLLDAANTNFLAMTDTKNSYFKQNHFRLLPVADINEHEYFSAISVTSSMPGSKENSILNLQGKVILAGGRGKDKQESVKFGLKHETRISENSIIGLALNVNIKESEGKVVNQAFTNSYLESYALSVYRSQKLNKENVFVSSIFAKHLSVDVLNQNPEIRIEAETTQNLLGLSFVLDSQYQGIHQNINYVSKIGMQTYSIDKAKIKISAQENDFTGNFDILADSGVMNIPFINLGVEKLLKNNKLALNSGLVCNLSALDEFAMSKCTRNTKFEWTRDLTGSNKIKFGCNKRYEPERREWMCATSLEIKF